MKLIDKVKILLKLRGIEKEIMMNKKDWWKSKTIWLNVVSVAVFAIDKLSGAGAIPADVAGVVIGVANVVLRIITTKAVK